MSERTYRIHELAALASVTVKALHHYDRVGLLKPRRTASRYRLYTTRDLTRLQQIVALRSLGLPLRRIRDLLAPGAPPLHLALRQQRQVLQDQRRLLDRTIRALETAEECGGDEEMASEQIRAWRSRRQWAPGFLRYMASCYEMDAATWLQVADFLESAVDRPVG